MCLIGIVFGVKSYLTFSLGGPGCLRLFSFVVPTKLDLHRPYFPRILLRPDAMALRLSYLPFQAMAETTRFLFRYGGVKYQDEVR